MNFARYVSIKLPICKNYRFIRKFKAFVLPAAVALSGWGKSDAVGGKGEAEDI